MKNITIVYGSTTGSTQAAADMISAALKTKGAQVDVHDVSKIDVNVVDGSDLVLLGASTWGEGDIQAHGSGRGETYSRPGRET